MAIDFNKRLSANQPSKILDYPLFPPMQHQSNTLDETANVKAYALFWGCGAGKSCGEILRYRWKCATEDRLIKWLIVCPLVVMENWKREIAKFSKIPASAIQIVNGIKENSRAKKKVSSMKVKLEQFATPAKQIFITNTETLQGLTQKVELRGGRKVKSLKRKEILEAMLAMNFEYITIDESHRFKNPTGVRSKSLHILGDQACVKYKTILTGTPILNDPSDIWAQYRFVAPWIFLENFGSFRRKYFVDKNAGMPSNVYFPNWVLNPGAAGELREKIHSISSVVTKEEVLDLPKKTRTRIDVPLSAQQKKLYGQMSKEMVATIATKEKVDIMPSTLDETLREQLEEMGLNTSKVMSVDLAIVKGLRLQQIVSGIFTDDETGKTHLIDNEADRILESLLDMHINKQAAQKNKVIIWCVFKDSYKILGDICKRVLPKGMFCTYLTGQQDYEEKINNMDTFNDDPNCCVIIANQGAGGTGVNLVASNKDYYYSRDFSLEKDLQSDARNHRGGQLREVERFDFVRGGTIDEQAYLALAKKKGMAKDILDVQVTSIFKELDFSKLLS